MVLLINCYSDIIGRNYQATRQSLLSRSIIALRLEAHRFPLMLTHGARAELLNLARMK